LFKEIININDKRTTNATVAIAMAVFFRKSDGETVNAAKTKKTLVKSSQFSKRKVLDYCPRTGFRTGMKP
jgi:hypothetical protein